MTLRAVGSMIAVCVLGWSLHGCVTVQAGADKGKPEGRSATRPQKENKYCVWSFDPDPGGGSHKIVKGSLDVTSKPGFENKCGVYESADHLYIGDSPENVKRIVSPPDGEFVMEGTCRAGDAAARDLSPTIRPTPRRTT
jgi:hypothetical protein